MKAAAADEAEKAAKIQGAGKNGETSLFDRVLRELVLSGG
jgi:hypothetical protein